VWERSTKSGPFAPLTWNWAESLLLGIAHSLDWLRNGGSAGLPQAGSYSFATKYGANRLTLRVLTAPVPKPGGWALMVASLTDLSALQRRRIQSLPEA
jgi:hypothetical protein